MLGSWDYAPTPLLCLYEYALFRYWPIGRGVTLGERAGSASVVVLCGVTLLLSDSHVEAWPCAKSLVEFNSIRSKMYGHGECSGDWCGILYGLTSY